MRALRPLGPLLLLLTSALAAAPADTLVVQQVGDDSRPGTSSPTRGGRC